MRPATNIALHSVLAAALIAFAATSAAAAIYMKYGTIKGDVAVKDGKVGDGWIQIDSYQWGETRAGVEREMKESGEKGGTEDINIGVGELQEMTISKPMDKSTPKLAEAVAKGKVFKAPAPRGSLTLKMPAGQCVVGARHPTATLDTPYMRYEMENVMVSSCSASRGGGGGGTSLPMEEISFNYDKISTAYTKQDKQAPKTEVRGWDPDKKQE